MCKLVCFFFLLCLGLWPLCCKKKMWMTACSQPCTAQCHNLSSVPIICQLRHTKLQCIMTCMPHKGLASSCSGSFLPVPPKLPYQSCMQPDLGLSLHNAKCSFHVHTLEVSCCSSIPHLDVLTRAVRCIHLLRKAQFLNMHRSNSSHLCGVGCQF